MSIPGAGDALLLASSASSQYTVSRSLRFNSSDSAFCSRTPSSAGNRKTWTFSCWVKRSAITVANSCLFSVDPSNSGGTVIEFVNAATGNTAGDNLVLSSNARGSCATTAVYRDTGAWMHIVAVFDTTQASDKQKLYVNGSLVATSNYGSLNEDFPVNSTVAHDIGRNSRFSTYFSGYLAEIHFIDGQALTPSSFAETNPTTGQWVPKAFSGSYGSQGWKLGFSDNSAATAAALGKDTSPNGNNFTPTNFSVSTSTTVYTNSFSISGTLYPGSSLANAFDGNTATSATVTNAAQNQTLTFAPSPGIAYTSGVEVYLTPTGDVSVTRYSFNGGPDQSFASGDGWKTVATGSGTLTSLVIKQGAQSNSVGISAIRINGTTILIDNAARHNDSLVDTPTSYGTGNSGGDVRGNYATLNPLWSVNTFYRSISNGNLDVTFTDGANTAVVPATIYASSGKWYAEFVYSSSFGSTAQSGIANTASTDVYLGQSTNVYCYDASGNKRTNAGQTSYGSSWTVGDVIGIALDLDNGNLAFYKNGVSQGVAFTGITGTWTFATCAFSGTCSANFGQRPFAYTAPSGFKALCDTNLPTPVVAKPSTVFDTKLYTGNGSSQTITGLGFSPDFVWLKSRSQAVGHFLFDQIRGAGKFLSTDSTTSESDFISTLSGFTSDGFSVGNNAGVNNNTSSYVGWAWDAGSSNATNNAGSIASTVRANASAGVSICTFTTQSSGTGTFGHGLNVAPSLVITKARAVANNWIVYHASVGNTGALLLNSTAATDTQSFYWNNTTPSSTVVTLGSGFAGSNSLVAYCFAPVSGYSSFGSYTGNGSADGPFVFCNFRPRWIMVKSASITGDWCIWDAVRSPENTADEILYADLSNAEQGNQTALQIDITANGFKIRGSNNQNNGSAQTYVWAAFAESPFQYARAR